MDRNINFNAYAEIENLSNYETDEELLEYRRSRVSKYQPVVDFIAARTPDEKKISIIEVGSGSSVLLYSIAKNGFLKEGIGVELSSSRYQFAEKWKEDEGFDMVQNLNSNFTDVEFPKSLSDWFVVIDNTFTYLYPEDRESPFFLLKKANDSLNANGVLLLDFINYSKRTGRGGDRRHWNEFPKTDPYAYGLYSQKIEGGLNRCESIFLKRDGEESRKIEYSKVYSLSDLLFSCGFKIKEVYSTFLGDEYIEAESARLVVVANKLAK